MRPQARILRCSVSQQWWGRPSGALYRFCSSPGNEAKAVVLLSVLRLIFLVCRPPWRRRCGSQRA